MNVRTSTDLKKQLLLRVSRSRSFPRIAKYIVRLDEYVTRDGRYHNSLVRKAGMKPVILFVRGRKTGTVREIRLLSIRTDDDCYVVVGSNWGKPSHPEWSANLLGINELDAVVRGIRQRVAIQHVTGVERDDLWPRLAAEWPNFDVYQNRVDRQFRVFRLRTSPA